MGFEEFKPGEPTFTPEPPWKGVLFILGLPIIILFNMCHPLARLITGEYVTRRESDGWAAEWKTARLICYYCGARVTRFEFEGQPYPVPIQWKNQKDMPFVDTPVGVFSIWKGKWRRGHWESSRYIARGVFDDEVQRRGWYETEQCDEDGAVVIDKYAQFAPWRPVLRKAGTPGDWCLLTRAKPVWFDPRRLEEVLEACGADEEIQT